MQSTSWETLGWKKHKAGIKIARRNINNLWYADEATLLAESKEGLKSFLMKYKKESEKAGLKIQHSENEDHGIRSHHFMGNRWRKWLTLFFGDPKSLQMVTAAMKLKMLAPWKENNDKPRQQIKKHRHYFADKGLSHQSYGFSSSHVWMQELAIQPSHPLLTLLLSSIYPASVLPMNIHGWFPLGLTGWISLQSKGLSRVFSNITV